MLWYLFRELQLKIILLYKSCFLKDKIRDYFGEKIAIYFGFLGYYTRALFLPSCLALYNCLLHFQDDNIHAQAPFAAFNIIYLSIFLKFWKRRCRLGFSKVFTWKHFPIQIVIHAKFCNMFGFHIVYETCCLILDVFWTFQSN